MNNAAFSQEARLDAFRKANNLKTYEEEVQSYFNSGKFYSLDQSKRWNRTLGHSISRLFPDDEKRINRVFSCGSQTSIVYSPSLHKSHVESFWCDERCCALCQYYKSRSLFSRVYNYVRSNSDKTYLFLTLTVHNVPMSELRDTVKRMNRAFGRMFKLRDDRSKTGKMFSGYIRRLEITYNIDSDERRGERKNHPRMPHMCWQSGMIRFILMEDDQAAEEDRESHSYQNIDSTCDDRIVEQANAEEAQEAYSLGRSLRTAHPHLQN